MLVRLLVPAYLALLAKGYAVTCQRSDNSETWTAENALGRFTANDPITLLGVVNVAELRGQNWHASDSEIEAFVTKFRE